MKESSLPRPLNIRAFVALVLALSTAGLPLTGIMNHYYGFDPLTPARHAWMAAHNCLSLLAMIFGLWHIGLNRRALVTHLQGIGRRLPAASRELLVASALVGTTTALFTAHGLLLAR